MSIDAVTRMPWRLWRRQIAAILRLEWRKTFWNRRAIWIYLLAAAPAIIVGLHSLVMVNGRGGEGSHGMGEDGVIFAGIFHFYYLRLAIFFGCVGIFSNLIRGEMLEKTMHYYLLAPVRRDILIFGKYIAGLAASSAIFGASIAVSYVWMFMHYGPEFQDFFFRGPGLKQMEAYVATAALACAAYGALFLVAGLLFRNPMIPAAIVMVWEAVNVVLPPLLKKFSVTFYLKSLAPVDVPVKGPISLLAIDAQAPPAWLAVLGLLALSAVLLYLAGRRARTLEISYGE